MRIGILGSGDVARALGDGFAGRGHDVIIGSRTPDSDVLKKWKAVGGKRSTGSPKDAVARGEVVVLATLGQATEAVISAIGQNAFRGKTVIDVTNPLDFSKGMPPGLFVGTTDSLGERVQRKIPEAKVVKAFNTISNSQMVDPKLNVRDPKMLICGNDVGAKATTERILKEFGWAGAIDAGGIEASRWLEAMVPLWVRVGTALNTWQHGWYVATP